MVNFPVNRFPVTTLLVTEELVRRAAELASIKAYSDSKGRVMMKPHELSAIEVSPEKIQEEVNKRLDNYVAYANKPTRVLHHGKAICIRPSESVPSLKERIEAIFGEDAVIGTFLFEGYHVVGYYENVLGHPQPIYKRIK